MVWRARRCSMRSGWCTSRSWEKPLSRGRRMPARTGSVSTSWPSYWTPCRRSDNHMFWINKELTRNPISTWSINAAPCTVWQIHSRFSESLHFHSKRCSVSEASQKHQCFWDASVHVAPIGIGNIHYILYISTLFNHIILRMMKTRFRGKVDKTKW